MYLETEQKNISQKNWDGKEKLLRLFWPVPKSFLKNIVNSTNLAKKWCII